MKYLIIIIIILFGTSCEKQEVYGEDDLAILYLNNVKLWSFGASDNFCGDIIINSSGKHYIYSALNIPDSIRGWQGGKEYEMKVKLLNQFTICEDPNVDPIGNTYPADIYQMVEILEVKRK